MSKFWSPEVRELTPYVPGEQPKEDDFVKLNTNENPYPPSQLVLERLREACDGRLRRYPDPDAGGVVKRLCALFGVDRDSVLVGNGSDELLNLAIRCFVAPGRQVVMPHPTYPYYAKLVQLQDGVPAPVPFESDYTLPPGFTNPDAAMTLIANPNSPSGTLLSNDALEEIATGTSGLVIADEAYVDFSNEGCLRLLGRCPNLIVMRTMSKSFSLAAMRIGYCFASPDLIAGLAKAKEHYNIGLLSQVAAEAALDDVGYMKHNAERVQRTRTLLTTELRRIGFKVWNSEANFVLARIEQPSAESIYRELKARGVLVRYFDEPLLRACLRISVGTEEETALLVSHLNDICDI